MWDALEARYGVSDAGSELYVMEQFHDYRMVEGRPVVEQAHEIQALVKELELFECVLPDKFVAGCIIAKLPQSWTDFATSLKHKRQEFSTAELVGTLDVEDKARAKDIKGKKVSEGNSSAHVVQKNHSSHRKINFSKNSSKSPPLLSRRVRSITRRKEIVSPVACLGTMQESALMLSGSHLLQQRNQQTPLRLRQDHLGMVIYYLLHF
jgi:hypothetical protein